MVSFCEMTWTMWTLSISSGFLSGREEWPLTHSGIPVDSRGGKLLEALGLAKRSFAQRSPRRWSYHESQKRTKLSTVCGGLAERTLFYGGNSGEEKSDDEPRSDLGERWE